MINNLTKAAQRSAHAIPNVFLRNGIKPYLSKRKLKFLARPLYQGMDFSVSVTLTDIVFTPSETEIFGTDGFGPDRACLTHYRRLLGQIGCDAVRLDGRALMKKDGRSRIADFFRFCMLRQGEPISYVLIYPDYADGQDGGLSQHYLELSKNNAMERLSSASTISHALPRKLGIAHKDAHELIDTVLWQCNASNFIYGFTVPVNLLSSCSIEEQTSDRQILKAPNVATSTQTNINAESCEDPAKPQLITKGAPAQALDRVSHLSHEGFLSFEEVLPTIDREVTYASHPIFVGPNISISLSQEGVSVYGDMRAGKVAKAISALCERATEKMKAFLARTMHNIGGDRVRLDARWVELNTGQRFLDVYRAVLFDRDTPYRTLPYLGQIFEDDVSKQGRMVTWLAPDKVREARKVVKDVSCAALGSSMRMMDSPQRCFEGLLWLPVNQDKYRPAFYIPYVENRLSESELSRIHLQICNNEINNFLYLKNGIPEISAKTKPPRR